MNKFLNTVIQGGKYKKISIRGKQIYEHRYIMETHLQRNLLPTEIVHHINHDKQDNRIENLTIMTRAEHAREHVPGVEYRFKMKYRIDKETLENLYLEQGLSLRQIGFKTGIPAAFLQRMRIKYGIYRPSKEKVFCYLCGLPAQYPKNRQCKKHYHYEYYRLHRKSN